MKNTFSSRFGGPFPSFSEADGQPWYSSRRFIIFAVAFLVSAAITLAYSYSRPVVYRSSATLLTSAMTAIDRGSADADIQHVAIQRQILLGHELAAETLARLKASVPDEFLLQLKASDIQNLLNVEAVPDTNLVEMRAEGSDPRFLPLLINTWIEVYLDARNEEVRRLTGDTTRIVEDELKGLSEKVNAARAELETFRENHDISSTGREENEALALLKGLTESLNKANEDEVKARSNLNAIKVAISRGKAVVPDDEKGSMLELEKRLHDLREKLADFDQKFTREYLELQPDLKSIPVQIRELEIAVQDKRQHGQNVVLNDAEMAYAAAQQTAREIRAQLNEHKHQASAFTSKFAQHEALKTDLEGLEKLYREAQERLVQVSTSRKEKYPQVSVINQAYEPRNPIGPDYTRDALIAIAGSLLFGLFSVWIFEFLTQRKEEHRPIAVYGVQGYRSAAGELLEHSQAALGMAEKKKTGFLASPALRRELSSHQLRILLHASNVKGKQLIGLLLSGLTLDEAASLTPEQIDLEASLITVPGKPPRIIPMSTFLLSLFMQSNGCPAWNSEDPQTRVDLSSALVCAAVDSGLPDPEEINPEAIRHSYIAYLVRQGLRLSDLEQVTGALAPAIISSYSAYSPPLQGRPISEIELLHPALANVA
ncbi:MAG: integrase [Nitrosospira sp.]|nr:integrase [Nitrosospira sp.]